MKRIILAIILIALLISCNNQEKDTFKTEVIAHRGFSEIAPENTLISFKKAMTTDAPYFELDVRQSKDGKLVVIHDHSVDRTSSNNKTGKVIEMTYEELQAVTVGFSKKYGDEYKNEKIPTLREVLALAKGKIKVCVEIKVKHIEQPVVKLIEEMGMEKQVMVFGFNYETVKKVKELNPKLATLYLKNKATINTIDKAKAISANAIGVRYKETNFTKEFIDYAHKNNIKVFTYTVNDEKIMKELIALKVDGLITNRPDLALKLTRK